MEENNSKEINLLQLIDSVLNWLKKVVTSSVHFLGSILQLNFKYKWISLIIIILCIIIGQYFARPTARVYKAEALGLLFCSDIQTVKEIFKQLENSLATNKELSLATKLSIPDSVSKNIISIKTFYVIDYLKDGTGDKIDYDNTHLLEDTVNARMNDRIYVQIKTMNISQIPQLQNALVKYLDSHPILNTALEARKRGFIDQINVCNDELNRIDSLATVEYFKNSTDQIKFENNRLILGEQNKQLFYTDLLQLTSLRVDAENNLIRYKHPVEFPSNFVVIPSPVNGRIKFGVMSIFIGYFLSLLLISIIDNRKRMMKFLNNEN